MVRPALTCKWTIRSDRVQNTRHENGNMIRHRGVRVPPAGRAHGRTSTHPTCFYREVTSEFDATYHVVFDERAVMTREVVDGVAATDR
ncbi:MULTISPECIES: NgoMIV family type II restriction endonuclease [unclassified Rhodococcus (in: high G+C Gram-positive bacteria)]|uniref:NgoMIV family type II restriction endonuclease n=1 Tax=unclassified Rhodococcus (in: high G+C Gram-positive bacteria) TaxID=192944 RepID=UPI0013030135